MTTRFDPFDPFRPGFRSIEPARPLPPPSAPAVAPRIPRPEAPHTHLTVHALSTAERTTLRGIAPALAVDLAAAERLRSSPLVWLSRGVTAATVTGEVDQLRRQARSALEIPVIAP